MLWGELKADLGRAFFPSLRGSWGLRRMGVSHSLPLLHGRLQKLLAPKYTPYYHSKTCQLPRKIKLGLEAPLGKVCRVETPPGMQGRGLLEHQATLTRADGMQAGQGQSEVLEFQQTLRWIAPMVKRFIMSIDITVRTAGALNSLGAELWFLLRGFRDRRVY